VDGEPQIQIYRNSAQAKAKIYSIDRLFAHTDQGELMEWAEGFGENP